MTVQIPQIHTPEPGLFQDSSAQNRSNNSFQQYLEQEQKRLAFVLSPFSQFNFNSWFGYPDFSAQGGRDRSAVDLFADIDLTSYQTNTTNMQNYQSNMQNHPNLSKLPIQPIINQYSTQPTNVLLEQLLLKTGWLVPNLEMHPFFYQAELEGKLLNKLDLQFLVDQILSQVKIVKEKGKVELTLGLRPENLGEILLTLTSRSGMVSIQIQAPEESRKLLEAELKELELALKKAKVNLAEIKIIATKEAGENA